MDKKILHNYIKLCKRKNIDTILNISNELSNTSLDIIKNKYDVNLDDIETIKQVGGYFHYTNHQNSLSAIYNKYMEKHNFSQNGGNLDNTEIELNDIHDKISEFKEKIEKIKKLKNCDRYLNKIKQIENIFISKSSIVIDLNPQTVEKNCACCDCAKDGYIFSDNENQKCGA